VYEEKILLPVCHHAMGQIWASGAMAAWLATAMRDAQPRHLEGRWGASHHIWNPLPCSLPSSPPTAPPLRALTHVHIRLLPQIRREESASAPPSWLICQPLESCLHKPPYPLVGMTTAQAHGGGNVSARHARCDEDNNPAPPGKPRRDGRGALPRLQSVKRGRLKVQLSVVYGLGGV
jgi:hypothetical protein